MRSHRKQGCAAVSFGKPLFLDELMDDPVAVAALPDETRKPAIAALGDQLLAAVAATIPATPVAVVATALVEGALEVAALRQRVSELLAGYRAAGRPLAQGIAFTGLNRSSAGDNPDLSGLDDDIGDAEEAERTVDLALRLLARRGLLEVHAGRVTPRADAAPILAYYARSLDPPTHLARAWKDGDPARTAG